MLTKKKKKKRREEEKKRKRRRNAIKERECEREWEMEAVLRTRRARTGTHHPEARVHRGLHRGGRICHRTRPSVLAKKWICITRKHTRCDRKLLCRRRRQGGERCTCFGGARSGGSGGSSFCRGCGVSAAISDLVHRGNDAKRSVE